MSESDRLTEEELRETRAELEVWEGVDGHDTLNRLIPRVLWEIEELKLNLVALNGNCFDSVFEIAQLRAQVAELQKDKERLDWAEQNVDDVSVSRDLSVGARWELTYCASETGCQVGDKANSFRAVIDAAMREEGQS